MTAPKEESVSLVKKWLDSEAPTAKVSISGDYVTVEGSVEAIEQLLKTKYNTYGKKTALFFARLRLTL